MDVRTLVSDIANPMDGYESVDDGRRPPSPQKEGSGQQQAHARKPVGESKRETGGAREGRPSYVIIFFCYVDTPPCPPCMIVNDVNKYLSFSKSTTTYTSKGSIAAPQQCFPSVKTL